MDTGKWAEAEPGQDGGSEGGCPHSWEPGKLSLFWGCVTLATKSRVCNLGIHLDPTLTMETQVALVVRTTFFHLWRIAQL